MISNWSAMSQAERDAAYNNNGAVANSAALIEARNAASKAYRAAHSAHLDIPYGPAPRQKVDLYPSKSAADAPCLVFIHGGYWQRNSREDFACYAAGIQANGWSCAMPSYTLGPDATLTEIVAEIFGALDYVNKKGEQHGIAARQIVLSGWSAGGHLTVMALSHPAVTAGLAISGVYDLEPLRQTVLNDKLHITDGEVAALSPLRLPVVPKPMAIAYGTRELPALVNDSRDLHAKRAAAHAPGDLIPISGADHFTILGGLTTSSGGLVRAARNLLDG